MLLCYSGNSTSSICKICQGFKESNHKFLLCKYTVYMKVVRITILFSTVFICDALFYRPQVPGAIAGSLLGEAAHRLVKNTLNLRSNDSSSGFWEQPPFRNFQGSHLGTRPRPTGPSGYGFRQEPNSYYENSFNPQGNMGRPRYPVSSNGAQIDRQNFKTLDRIHYQEQYRNLRSGMSALTMEENARSKPPAMLSPRIPNSGNTANPPTHFMQNMGPLPSPPPKWINKAPTANGGMYVGQLETASGGPHEKQVKKIYQVKTRAPQDTSNNGNQGLL